MKQRTHIALCLLVLTCAIGSHAQAPAYKVAGTQILGGSGGWDYIVPDPASHRLFIARETRLMVVDENTGKLITEIADLHGAHGTAIAAGTGHGFATSSEDKSVVMFDSATYKILKRIPAAFGRNGVAILRATQDSDHA